MEELWIWPGFRPYISCNFILLLFIDISINKMVLPCFMFENINQPNQSVKVRLRFKIKEQQYANKVSGTRFIAVFLHSQIKVTYDRCPPLINAIIRVSQQQTSAITSGGAEDTEYNRSVQGQKKANRWMPQIKCLATLNVCHDRN